MKESVPDLNETPQVLEFVKTWSSYGFSSVLIFLAFGTALTLVLQSSSATMALTLIMLSMGWIPFEMACAMVLGENIGTTITANIAASVGNTQAKRAAMSHTLFNVFGVLWALIFFKPFLSLVEGIIESLGVTDPNTAALYGLSMLHTLFNTINTLLLIWFVKYIEKAVVWIVKTPKNQETETFRLKYISAGYLATPELASEQALDEIIHFAQISRNGLGYVKQAVEEKSVDKFEELNKKLVKYEEISDRIEYEIATFLNNLSNESISKQTSVKIKAMYKIIGELESLGDSAHAIGRIISRRNSHKKAFDEATIKKLQEMIELVDKAYESMIENLTLAKKSNIDNISNAYNAENHINDLRNKLRDKEIEEIETGEKNYQTSVYYMDIVNELERMGDFVINISEDLEKSFSDK
jgi:phosphate:Na+ symporter